jgi:hypothetical protein
MAQHREVIAGIEYFRSPKASLSAVGCTSTLLHKTLRSDLVPPKLSRFDNTVNRGLGRMDYASGFFTPNDIGSQTP